MCTPQPDGSVHGNARSYGPYEGMTISISIMLNDDGNSWRLCDTPEAHALLSLPHHSFSDPRVTEPRSCFCTGEYLGQTWG